DIRYCRVRDPRPLAGPGVRFAAPLKPATVYPVGECDDAIARSIHRLDYCRAAWGKPRWAHDHLGSQGHRNLGVGLIGALVGGLLFRMLGLAPGLDRVAISLRDVVAACVGSLIVLVALWIWRRYQTSR